MRWDTVTGLPVPGTYKVKDTALEKLLLEGWHKKDLSGRNAEGILPYAVQSGKVKDPVLLAHYMDILEGRLVMKTSWPAKQDTFCRLYFCDSEEDIWDMLRDGLGDTESFIRTYAGYSAGKPGLTASSERLDRFCKYMERWDPGIRPRIDFIRSLSAAFSPEDFYMGGISSQTENHR